VWDLETGECVRVLEGHTGSVSAVSITPDGRKAVSGGSVPDDTIRLWDLETGSLKYLTSLLAIGISLAFNGVYLAGRTENDGIVFYKSVNFLD
jgi:WD40 repeat protein